MGEEGDGIVRGVGLQAGVCKVDIGVEGVCRRGGLVGQWGKEGEELAVDVDAQGAEGEDVAAEMEFAVLPVGK